MDLSHIVTIVITALVTAIAKPFFEWLVSLVRRTAAAKTFGAMVRAAFSKDNRTVMFDAVHAAAWCVILLRLAIADGMPTRTDILMIVGAVVMVLFTMLNLLWDIARIAVRRAREKAPLTGA